MVGQGSRGTKTFAPGPRNGVLRAADGSLVDIPAGWVHVAPGDAAVTRRIKAHGEAWVVEEARGNKRFGRGLWAPAAIVDKVTRAVAAEKSSPDYQRKLDAGRERRAREQADYVVEFMRHVLAFLAFSPTHRDVAERLARRVAEHATPVGSGTVARTERIPVAERAEAAVIAWMRHQTTAYDTMSIARVAGRRREVRRALAARSRELLDRYRRGLAAAEDCPLASALATEPRPLEGSRSRAPTVRHALKAASVGRTQGAATGRSVPKSQADLDPDDDVEPDDLDVDDLDADDLEPDDLDADDVEPDDLDADDMEPDDVEDEGPSRRGGGAVGRAGEEIRFRILRPLPAAAMTPPRAEGRGRPSTEGGEASDQARRARMEAVRARMQRGRKT
jgi:hypothetical protein